MCTSRLHLRLPLASCVYGPFISTALPLLAQAQHINHLVAGNGSGSSPTLPLAIAASTLFRTWVNTRTPTQQHTLSRHGVHISTRSVCTPWCLPTAHGCSSSHVGYPAAPQQHAHQCPNRSDPARARAETHPPRCRQRRCAVADVGMETNASCSMTMSWVHPFGHLVYRLCRKWRTRLATSRYTNCIPPMPSERQDRTCAASPHVHIQKQADRSK